MSFSHDGHSVHSVPRTSMKRCCPSPRTNRDASDAAEGLRMPGCVRTQRHLFTASLARQGPSVSGSGFWAEAPHSWWHREPGLRGRCHLVNASCGAQSSSANSPSEQEICSSNGLCVQGGGLLECLQVAWTVVTHAEVQARSRARISKLHSLEEQGPARTPQHNTSQSGSAPACSCGAAVCRSPRVHGS